MPPDEPEFFIDRCLGSRTVAQALKSAGLTVHVHDDHFKQDCKDEDWLTAVGPRGWVVLSKDGRIQRRHLETKALRDAGVAAFIVISGGLDGQEIAAVIIKAMPRIRSLLSTHTRPLLGRVYKNGDVKVLFGERRGGIKRGP